MRPAVAHDFEMQRVLLPEVKRVIAGHLIVEAPIEEDMKHNTDLIVLKLDTVRVACRIRRYQYLARYGDEFTIRASRPSGVKTELQKVLEGWGDYLFYGFAAEKGDRLVAWMLGRLSVFRLWHHRSLAMLPPGRMPGAPVPNGDKSSEGRAYRITDLPEDFIVARNPSSTPIFDQTTLDCDWPEPAKPGGGIPWQGGDT